MDASTTEIANVPMIAMAVGLNRGAGFDGGDMVGLVAMVVLLL